MKKMKLPHILGAAILLCMLGIAVFFATKSENTPSNDTPVNTSSKTCTTYDSTAEEQCIEDYIGLSREEAIARAKQYKYIPIVARVDGKNVPFGEIGGALIYFEIEDGVVSSAYFYDGSPNRGVDESIWSR